MADVQTPDDIDATGKKLRDNDPPPLPDDPHDGLGIDDKRVASRLADIKRREIAADDKTLGAINSATAQIPKLEQMSKDAGVEAGRLKPWNEEAEAAKRQTDPIEAFASLGSVFGILASAFTHAPMQNAMEASAAAINAIKAGNAEDYNRAYKAWEDNTKQALERHKIEHEKFEDALTLLKTNMEAGMSQLKVNAVRFGNQKDLAYIEAGMLPELLQYKEAQVKLAKELNDVKIPMAESNAEMAVLLNNGYNPKNPNDPKNMQALKALAAYKADMAGLSKVPNLSEEQGKAIRDYSTTPGPDGKLPTPEERKEYIKDIRTTKALSVDQETMARWDEEHPEATSEERRDFAATLPSAKGKASQRKPKPEEEAVRARATELEKEGHSKAEAIEIAQREYKLKTAAPTGNRIDDIKGREAKVGYMEDTIDKIDNELIKHKAITGLGGKVTRAGEAIGNILGSSATDRAQFRRWVLEMQAWGMSVLNDRNGKPISSEAEKMEGIFAGLAAGDTNANTLRGYDEIRPLLKTIKRQLRERRGAEPESATPEIPRTAPRWEDAPVVGAH